MPHNRPGRRPVRIRRLLALAGLASPALALAQVKIGLVLSLTGPAASLGLPARDTAAMFRQMGLPLP